MKIKYFSGFVFAFLNFSSNFIFVLFNKFKIFEFLFASSVISEIFDIIKNSILSFDPRPQTEKFAEILTDLERFISSEHLQRQLKNVAPNDTTEDDQKNRINSMSYINQIKSIAQNFFILFFWPKGKATKDRIELLNSELLRRYPINILKEFTKNQMIAKFQNTHPIATLTKKLPSIDNI